MYAASRALVAEQPESRETFRSLPELTRR